MLFNFSYYIRKTHDWDGIDSFYTEWLRRQTATETPKTPSNAEPTAPSNVPDCPLKRRLEEEGIIDQHNSSDSSELEEALTQPRKKRKKINNTVQITSDSEKSIDKDETTNDGCGTPNERCDTQQFTKTLFRRYFGPT